MRSLEQEPCVVIMAGGAGTRFWPLSTELSPKQFLRPDGEESLLQQSYSRADALTSADRILVLTSEHLADRVGGCRATGDPSGEHHCRADAPRHRGGSGPGCPRLSRAVWAGGNGRGYRRPCYLSPRGFCGGDEVGGEACSRKRCPLYGGDQAGPCGD